MSGLNGDELAAHVAAEADAAYIHAGYVDADGAPDKGKVADVLVEPVSRAVASNLSERKDANITRSELMGIAFPSVPGAERWASQPDPKVAELVYNKLDTDVWRAVDPFPSGQVQLRLNGSGFVLVRRNQTSRIQGGVYVTRDPSCLVADVLVPQSEGQIYRATRSARLTALLMERVPDAAKKFDKELTRGLNESKSQAKAITGARMAVIEAGRDDDDGE